MEKFQSKQAKNEDDVTMLALSAGQEGAMEGRREVFMRSSCREDADRQASGALQYQPSMQFTDKHLEAD